MNRGLVHALVFALGGSIWGGRLLQKSLSPQATPLPHVAFDPQEADRNVCQLERQIKTDPGGATGLGMLAGAYLRRQREQGDPDDLLRAESAARRSVAVRPYNNPTGFSALARALVGQHRFQDAESFAKRAGDLSLAGECALERGEYASARALLGDAALASPDDPGVRVTQARLLELTGERDRAESAYRSALEKIESTYEVGAPTRAWFHTRLGIFLATYGKLQEAKSVLERANEIFENPQTSLALARLASSEGNWDEAAEIARPLNLPEATMLLSDAEFAVGSPNTAVALAGKVVQESGSRHIHGRALALFLADRDSSPILAVSLMQQEWRARKDVETADALAWTLLKAKKLPEASKIRDIALANGYAAPTFLWHAGRIAEAQGDRRSAADYYARCLKTNPNFHPVGNLDARSRLERLK